MNPFALLALAPVGAVLPYAAVLAASQRWTRPLAGLPACEVALVPGAYVMADGTPGPHLRARLDLAVSAYRAGKVARILCSGGFPEGGRDELASMHAHLLQQGVAEDAIQLHHEGNTTFASVTGARDLGVDSMIICSQDYLLARAVTTARLLGLQAWGLADRETLRVHPRTSRRGALREVGASLKMIKDVALDRR